MTDRRPTLAVSGGASCGGCEVALVNLGERFLALGEAFDIVSFPMIVDHKREALAGEADASIDLGLFMGAIRSHEDQEMAGLLRRKSKILVAFGSCAQEGCVPGLANLSTPENLLETVASTASSEPGHDKLWFDETERDGRFAAPLPRLLHRIRTLDQVAQVDYFVPGCPPESASLWRALDVLEAASEGEDVTVDSSRVLGADAFALCEECPASRQETTVHSFRRTHEVSADPAVCLLEQGLICSGIATRAGCGALCISVGMPCRGCYGAVDGGDSGARMVAALASSTELDPDAGEEKVDEAFSSIVDPVGMLYRFSLAQSLLGGARRQSRGEP